MRKKFKCKKCLDTGFIPAPSPDEKYRMMSCTCDAPKAVTMASARRIHDHHQTVRCIQCGCASDYRLCSDCKGS